MSINLVAAINPSNDASIDEIDILFDVEYLNELNNRSIERISHRKLFMTEREALFGILSFVKEKETYADEWIVQQRQTISSEYNKRLQALEDDYQMRVGRLRTTYNEKQRYIAERKRHLKAINRYDEIQKIKAEKAARRARFLAERREQREADIDTCIIDVGEE